MKLSVLTLIFFSLVASAQPVKVKSTQNTFTVFTSILTDDVATSEKMLREYMEDTMNCTRIRLNLNVEKEAGVFTKGLYDVELTADCDTSFSSFRLDFDALCRFSGEASLLLEYSKQGQKVSKRFVIQNSESCGE